MSPEQVELEKARIQARVESERNRMELEKARFGQETMLREIDLAGSGHREAMTVSKWRSKPG